MATLGRAAAPESRWRRLLSEPCFQLPILIVLALILFSAGLGLRDPWPSDEPRFALVAQEMVTSGDWLFPRRGGELYPDKPPVFMWAIALFYLLTGSIRIAFLLPSLLAGLIITGLVYDLGRRLWTQRIGFYAGLALLTIFQFTNQAKLAQIDMLLTLWTTLGLYGLLRHLLVGPNWTWYAIGFAAMGLGVITKGVGFLPLLVLIPWALARQPGWSNAPAISGPWWRWATGPVALLIPIALWLVPMLLVVDASGDPALEAYRDNILWHQTAERYADAWHHIRPWWYQFQSAAELWLPFTLFLPWLLPLWWRGLRSGDARFMLLLPWIVLVVIFFSISAGKRGVYILPATPALALMIAPLIPALLRKTSVQNLALAISLLIGFVFLGLGLTGGWLNPEWAKPLLDGVDIDPWLMVSAAGTVVLSLAIAFGRKLAPLGLASVFWSFWLFYGWWGYPLLNPVRSTAPFMQSVSARMGTDAELAIIGWREQHIQQAGRPLTSFGFRADIADQAMQAVRWLKAEDTRWLMITASASKKTPCFSLESAIALGLSHRENWYLMNREQIQSDCLTAPPRNITGSTPAPQ